MSAFVIELLGRLEPDSVDVLIHQTKMMRNSSLGPYDPTEFDPKPHFVVVNALFYASLGVILLAASIAMLIKSWVREFDRGLQALSIPEQRAKTREFRYLAMERWKLAYMVAGLPFLIQISLVLFALGLVILLFNIDTASFRVTTAIFGVGVLYYATTTTISVFVTSSPFHSPLSRLLGNMYQFVHARFCPGLDYFLSPNMDTTPVTAFGRLRRRIQIFLQKSRPYLETEFETPIAAATVDEFQLSTTTSALQRILDSVPKSQHSELIHQSVWQVAGSPALRIQPLFKLPSWVLDRGNDKEYFSRLSPASAVALTSVFVRMRQPRYKERIVAVADIHSEGHWPQVVHAIFDLLPNNFLSDDHARLQPARLRDAVFRDALLRHILPDAPILDALRNALLRKALRDGALGDDPLRDIFRDSPHNTLGRPFVRLATVLIACFLLVSSVFANRYTYGPDYDSPTLIGTSFLTAGSLTAIVLILDMFGAPRRASACVLIIGTIVITGTVISGALFNRAPDPPKTFGISDPIIFETVEQAFIGVVTFSHAVLAVGALVPVAGALCALRPFLHDTLRRPFAFVPCVLIVSGAIVGAIISEIVRDSSARFVNGVFTHTFSLVVLGLGLLGVGVGMLGALHSLFVFFACILIVSGTIIANFFEYLDLGLGLIGLGLGLGMLGTLRRPLFFACVLIVGGTIASSFSIWVLNIHSSTFGTRITSATLGVVGLSVGFIGLVGLGLDMSATLRRPLCFFTCIFFTCGTLPPSLTLVVIIIVVVVAVVNLVSTLSALLPLLRRALLCDEAILRDHDSLRNSLRDDSFFAGVDTPFFESLVYVYTLFCDVLEDDSLEKTLCDERTLCTALFRNPPLLSSFRLFDIFLRLRDTRFDDMIVQGRISRAYLEPEEPNDLINILQTNQLQDKESIWLLNTLSWLHYDGLVLMKHHVSKICLAILLRQAPEWNEKASPNIMLIESVVTLVAISCSSNETYQREILTNSHKHPWLLLNLRNPRLISGMIENINHIRHNEPISLLFLVVHALILRGSVTLAAQYLTIIIAKCDFPLCASALIAIAPALGDDGLSAIGGLLLAPQAQFLTPEVDPSMSDDPRLALSHQSLFNNYDLQLGASQFPDPNIFAILLLLSKNLGPSVIQKLQGTDLKLRNPWLQLAAKVISHHDISDESGMNFEPFHDHRVHNMVAALSLLQYSDGEVIHHIARESLLLASFLPSREFVISSLALNHYLETVMSYSNLPPPSCYLSGGVQALFSPILPDNYLPMGWKVLHEFMAGFDKLSVEWQQTFVEAFFTMSHQPLLNDSRQNGTLVTELNEILTWDYFYKKEQDPVFTDQVFGGLDWMAMAWSLSLSQLSSTTAIVSAQRAAQAPGLGEPLVNEEFVLRVLCRLLDAAPYYSILPITPKLHEFVGWFDDTKFLDYQGRVIASIEGAEEEHERCKKFKKFLCVVPFG